MFTKDPYPAHVVGKGAALVAGIYQNSIKVQGLAFQSFTIDTKEKLVEFNSETNYDDSRVTQIKNTMN